MTKKKKAVAFILRVPRGPRKTFSILRQGGDGRSVTLQDERIDALNAALKLNPEDYNRLLVVATELRETLYKELRRHQNNPTPHAGNLVIFGKFWKNYLATHRTHQDADSLYHDFLRAITALGQLSVLTGGVENIQAAVAGLPTNKQRRVILRLRAILRFVDRSDAAKGLILPREEFLNVAHMRYADFPKMTAHLPPHTSLIARLLAFTGCRIGELFALVPTDWNERDGTILVSKQMMDTGKIRNTKNLKSRRAFVWPEAKEDLRAWLAVPVSDRFATRNRRYSDHIKKSCKIIGIAPLRAHDLRHCYCIWLLEKGVQLHIVAKMIGDGVAVTEKYYSGYALSDGMVQGVKNLFGGEGNG